MSGSVLSLFGHEIFVKIEPTEYLSNQQTYTHFDQIFIFPVKNWNFEQFFIFRISKMFQITGSPTNKPKKNLYEFCTDIVLLRPERSIIMALNFLAPS